MAQITYERVTDYIDIEGNETVSLALTTSGVQTSGLVEGIYDVICDVDAFIKIGSTANDVTTSTGYKVLAGNCVPVFVRQASKIGAILATGTGTLKYHKVG